VQRELSPKTKQSLTADKTNPSIQAAFCTILTFYSSPILLAELPPRLKRHLTLYNKVTSATRRDHLERMRSEVSEISLMQYDLRWPLFHLNKRIEKIMQKVWRQPVGPSHRAAHPLPHASRDLHRLFDILHWDLRFRESNSGFVYFPGIVVWSLDHCATGPIC